MSSPFDDAFATFNDPSVNPSADETLAQSQNSALVPTPAAAPPAPAPAPAPVQLETTPAPQTLSEQTLASIEDMLAPPEEETPPATLAPRPFEMTPGPAPIPAAAPLSGAQPEQIPTQLREEIMRRLSGQDPTDAFIFAAQLGAAAAEQRVMRELGAIKESVLQSTVAEFKRKVEASDPKVYHAIQKDFDAQVSQAEAQLRANPQVAATLTSEHVHEALDTFYAKAKANAFDRLLAKGRTSTTQATPATHVVTPGSPSPIPPNYSPAGGGPAPAQSTLVPKSTQDRLTIEWGRGAGLTDAEISDMLK